MADDKPIIIIKKKGGHGGHHGGAWKVAYADFVTAMMAFFMVMWLVNSASDPTRENIASYFRKPGLFQSGSGTPLLIGNAGILPDAPPPKPDEKKNSQGNSMERLQKRSGTDDTGQRRATEHGEKERGQGDKDGLGEKTPTNPEEFAQENFTSHGISMQQTKMQTMAAKIEKTLAESKELRELLGIVDVKVDADGLNIEIMDTEKASMFTLGSARVQPEAEEAFKKIGVMLAKLPNNIDIVGHTDARTFPGNAAGYSNWELSSDRANAARRLLVAQGVTPGRITSVVGRADKELKKADAPADASNRRITIKMRFRTTQQVDLAKDPLALNNLNLEEEDYQKKQAENVHTFSAKQINEGQKNPGEKPKLPGTVLLPTTDPPKSNPDYFGRDTIFNDSPVLGPEDHFAHY